jgi:hypothetical protein
MYPGTTTRTGPPWMRGSGSEFISQASNTSSDMALPRGMELPRGDRTTGQRLARRLCVERQPFAHNEIGALTPRHH